MGLNNRWGKIMRHKSSFLTEFLKFILILVCLLDVSVISYDIWKLKMKEREDKENNKTVVECEKVLEIVDVALSYAKLLEKQGKLKESKEVRNSMRLMVETCR